MNLRPPKAVRNLGLTLAIFFGLVLALRLLILVLIALKVEQQVFVPGVTIPLQPEGVLSRVNGYVQINLMVIYLFFLLGGLVFIRGMRWARQWLLVTCQLFVLAWGLQVIVWLGTYLPNTSTTNLVLIGLAGIIPVVISFLLIRFLNSPLVLRHFR